MLFRPRRQNPESEKTILLYGLQRSGTNYLQSLVQLNLPSCRFLNGEARNRIDHKHFRLYDDKNKIPEPQFLNDSHFGHFADFEVSLPVKPDLFIIISKDPWHWLKSYKKWAQKNNWPKPAYHYIEEYNLFYGKWKQFQSESSRVLFFRYEELLTNPGGVIGNIAKALGLPEPGSVRITKKVYASRRFSEKQKQEFLNEDLRLSLQPEESALLNPTLLHQLGY